MALYQDLPVFADLHTLTHQVFLFTQDYPREYKFTLGQDMKRDCLALYVPVELLIYSVTDAGHQLGC